MEFGKICECKNIKESYQTFKNGTTHLRMDCKDCNKFIGYKQQMIDPEVFTFPFGKHKGLAIYETPNDYLEWLLNQDWLKDNLRTAINDYLEN
mgnify:CR=1 FL=1|tara:strand:+ start:335 stop:613 length:279 start_codon:yes stop_codon:yes gene_type:complete